MTEKSGHKRFYELLELISDTYARKNSDYSAGNPLGNFYECERAGISAIDGLLTRISDKYSRLCTLNKKSKQGESPSVKGESMTDTALDLSVYSLILIILIEEENKKNDKAKI